MAPRPRPVHSPRQFLAPTLAGLHLQEPLGSRPELSPSRWGQLGGPSGPPSDPGALSASPAWHRPPGIQLRPRRLSPLACTLGEQEPGPFLCFPGGSLGR